MTINEWNNKLVEIEVPQNLYSIMIGGLPNERLTAYSSRADLQTRERETCDYDWSENPIRNHYL